MPLPSYLKAQQKSDTLVATYYIENSGTIPTKNGNIEPLDNGDDKNKRYMALFSSYG